MTMTTAAKTKATKGQQDKSAAGTSARQTPGQIVPEQWDVENFPRKDYKQLQALYGPLVMARENPRKDPKLHKVNPEIAAMGLEALHGLRAQAAARWGGLSAAKKSVTFLWNTAQVRERALLVVIGKGKRARHVPLVHLGPAGYTPLTQKMAQDSMSGRKAQEQAPPPGVGFTQESKLGNWWARLTHKGNGAPGKKTKEAAEKLSSAMDNPMVTGPLRLTGAALTVYAAYNAFEEPITKAAGTAKDWIMRKVL